MHRSALGGILIDCNTDDLGRDAKFWGEALGFDYTLNPDNPKYIELSVPRGRPDMEIQSVEHPSRVHLDIKTDDLEAEVKRLEKLGARRVERIRRFCVMEAPSGHRFCVVPLYEDEDVGELNTWD
ncbi:MAG: VOC family protein [Gammaproteobacteria bacterium]